MFIRLTYAEDAEASRQVYQQASVDLMAEMDRYLSRHGSAPAAVIRSWDKMAHYYFGKWSDACEIIRSANQ